MCWSKHYRRWKAGITHEGRNQNLGTFAEEEQAAEAALDAALKHSHDGAGAEDASSSGGRSDAKKSKGQKKKNKKPTPTRSSLGYAAASKEKLMASSSPTGSQWKMKHFANIGSKVGAQG